MSIYQMIQKLPLNRKLATVCCAILPLLLFAPLSRGQVAPTASLVGTVSDSTGAVIPNASVTLRNPETQLTRQTSTGGDGQYRFTLIPIGNYSLEVSASGLAPYRQSGIRLNVDSTARVDVVLNVGAALQSVTVSADAVMVNTESGTLNQVVQQRYIEELPLNGRNAATLVRMVPGTVSGVGTTTAGYANTSETQAISVNGARGNEVNYKLDGATHMDNVTNLNAIYPNPDALSEFSVQTSNYSAQYGDAAGAVVNIITKSGTNQFHGTAFDFLRNGSLNARNFFAAQHDNLKRNQFGGTFGGPVIHDRLFFFGSYQGTPIRNTSFSNTAFVPSAAERAGDFSALTKRIIDPITNQPFDGNIIRADRISPIARNLLEHVPTTTDPTGLLRYARPDRSDSHQVLGKVDYNLTHHMLSGSFFYARYNDPGWDGDGTLLTARIGQLQTTRTYHAQDVWTITPNLLNTLVGSVLLLDSYNTRTSPYSLFDFGDINIAAPAAQTRELELSVTGYGGWGSVTNSPPGQWIRRNVEISDTISYNTGKHQFSTGVEVSPYIVFDSDTRYQQSGNFSFSGQVTGNGLADLLLGKVATFNQSAGKFKRTRGREFSVFAQDRYRITNTLSLDLGVRWDPFLPYHDELGQVTGYQPGFQSQRFPNAPLGAIFPGDPGFPDGGMNNGWNNFAPRFGFAWNPRQGSHPTTIRGGYGIFYVRPFPRLYNNFVENAPFSPTVSLSGVDLQDPYGSAGVANPFPPFAPIPLNKDAKFALPTNLAYFQRDWRVGDTQAWNLTVEQQLTRDVLLRVAYVGNKGTHLQSFKERNAAVYGPGATLRNTDARRPLYPLYASMKEMVDNGNSSYHSLQVTVDKRFSRNFAVLAFYTWSKSIDTESNNAQFTLASPNPNDDGFNRAVSDFDVPHNFRITGTYDLPRLENRSRWLRTFFGGWSFNQILDWRTGTPFSLVSGRDNSFTGMGLDRADITGNPGLSLDRSRQNLISQYFDTSLVHQNAPGTFGNSPRNFLRNQSFFNVDASLHKAFAITERLNFQLRGEAFNLLNNVHLNQPGANASATSSFGVITGAGDPRILQLGARISF